MQCRKQQELSTILMDALCRLETDVTASAPVFAAASWHAEQPFDTYMYTAHVADLVGKHQNLHG
jgi:hypothetical protein